MKLTPFDFFLHAGESCESANENVLDAILLGSKRIGHGFQLIQWPNLETLVKERQICIECCPVSNFVLGYCHDMRLHPVRSFMHSGVPVSVSPDDPGFWGYEGSTLDFVYAFLAWELDVRDLKQLCINSVKFASVTEEQKKMYEAKFEKEWKKWIMHLNSLKL